MADISIDIDISGYLEDVDVTRNKDIPFVTAKALTRTVQDGQIEVRRTEERVFHLRNAWTQQGVKITPAEKLSWPITAEVYTDTGNAKAPDYLADQEDGGMKVAHEGHAHIAIPTRILRGIIGANTVIPDALRPANLLAAAAGSTHTSRKRDRLGGLRQVKTARALQYVGFKQYLRGSLYIFARRPNARTQGTLGPHEAFPFYLLVPQVVVRARLQMQETVERIAEERFEQHWDDAWDGVSN